MKNAIKILIILIIAPNFVFSEDISLDPNKVDIMTNTKSSSFYDKQMTKSFFHETLGRFTTNDMFNGITNIALRASLGQTTLKYTVDQYPFIMNSPNVGIE